MNTEKGIKYGLIGLLVLGGGFLIYQYYKGRVTSTSTTDVTAAGTPGGNVTAQGSNAFNLAQPTGTNSFTASLLMLQNGEYTNGVPLLPTSSTGYTPQDALYGTGPGTVIANLNNGFTAVTNSSGQTTLVPGLGSLSPTQ